MDNYSDFLKDIQDMHIETLKILTAICNKYDIRFFAIGGTLLGAVRHKGFIPWDDDIDIGMTREDFLKLCKVPKKEWGDQLYLCTPAMSNEIHDKFFARIYIRNTKVQSETDVENWLNWSNNKPWSTSLNCDIFIYDFAPDNQEDFLKIKNKCDKYRELYSITRHKPYSLHGSLKKKAIKTLKRIHARVLRTIWKEPWKHYDNITQKLIEKECVAKNRYGCYRSGHPFFNYTYAVNEVFPLIEMPFETISVPVPNCWEQMLVDDYGDYMTPPPPSERSHLTPSFLDLGDGVEHLFRQPLPGSLGDHS